MTFSESYTQERAAVGIKTWLLFNSQMSVRRMFKVWSVYNSTGNFVPFFLQLVFDKPTHSQ